VNAALARLRARCQDFLDGPAAGAVTRSIEFFAEARYPDQVWELDVPLRGDRFESPADVETLRQDFHSTHRETFAVADDRSAVEIITWGARARAALNSATPKRGHRPANEGKAAPHAHATRPVFFDGAWGECDVFALEDLPLQVTLAGPAIVESPSTTIVLPAGAVLTRGTLGSLLINPTEGRPIP
jgi:N-methylhydantoinase A